MLEPEEILSGVVDLYVHASPDVLPRLADDLELASHLQGVGYRAAVHRNHFGPTAERAALARRSTAFELYGALLLDASVGGICPAAAEVALRMGAVWLGLPTVSAREFRTTLADRPAQVRELLDIGGDVEVVNRDGAVLSSVREVLTLVAEYSAVLGTGYLAPVEVAAVIDAALDANVESVVVSNPLSGAMGMSPSAVIDLLEVYSSAWLEISVYQHHSSAGAVPGTPSLADCVPVIQRIGVDRVLLSSDGGMVGAPWPEQLLMEGCEELVGAGMEVEEVIRLVQTNPARLLKM